MNDDARPSPVRRLPGRHRLDLPESLRAARAAGLLRLGDGPFLRAVDGASSRASQVLVDAWARGELLRLVRGVYTSLPLWASLAPWERFRLAACAHALTRPDAVFTGTTAAALHGLPLVTTPPALEVRATCRGHRGTRRLVGAHVSAAGGRALRRMPGPARTPLPAPPKLSLRWNALQVPEDQVSITVSCGPGLGTASVRVDGLATVQLQLGAQLPFREAVPPLDALAAQGGAPAQAWAQENAALLPSAAAGARFGRAWGFVDARSESAGESFSRALIEELGFERPQLQHEFHDAAGRFVARTDFWWESVRVTGEFDGVGKYDIDLHGSEADRRASIRREQERERRLRGLVRHQAHWTWADLKDPDRLAEELRRAGVPQRR